MYYTDLIFDLYGTLIDTHTEVDDVVWEKLANYMELCGASYTGKELEEAFESALLYQTQKEKEQKEDEPDIPFDDIWTVLLQRKGIADPTGALAKNVTQFYFVLSMEYHKVYPHVQKAMKKFRKEGCRLWLLSNAQASFTAHELRALGLDQCFDGIYLSSDYRYRKPDPRFFQELLVRENLDPKTCIMIGNDLETDIAGAKNVGLSTLYLHTNLTPSSQREADVSRFPENASSCDGQFEFEGSNWKKLSKQMIKNL